MNIAVINRKGGVSKSTLSKFLTREFNRLGENTILVDTDIYHKDYTDNDVVYNPSDDEIDSLLSEGNVIFDTGGLVTPTTDALAQVCDLVIIPTGIYSIELNELDNMLNHLDSLGVQSNKILIVPTRIHNAVSTEAILHKMDNDFPVTPPMRMRVGYSNGRPCVKCNTEMYNIVQFIKEHADEL